MADEWVSTYIGHDPGKAKSIGAYLGAYSPCSLAQRTECMSGNGLPLPLGITTEGGETYLIFWKMLRDGVNELCVRLHITA